MLSHELSLLHLIRTVQYLIMKIIIIVEGIGERKEERKENE
jgi:hypothetical protein